MGALTIAFDTILVGALALPWVLLVIHLFYFEGENRLEGILDWVKEKEQQAAVGVLLFAVTYTLGSAVSRTARDFFNDDDLRIQVGGQLFRVAVTEDRIVASVYCNFEDSKLLTAANGNPAIAAKIDNFSMQASQDGCQRILKWSERHKYLKSDDDLIDAARDLFGLQENALLLKGEDPSLRLRQLHDQIMVLRGAAFDGVVTFCLCVFAWGAALTREKARSWVRMTILPLPALLLAVAIVATVHHFGERAPSDPPYMEFTLLLLAVSGAWLIWRGRRAAEQPPINRVLAKEAEAVTTTAETEKKFYLRTERWPRLIGLSAVLTLAVLLAWWSTEVLYAEQVIYSFDSLAVRAPAQK